jgi:UDP-N-acetylmuramoylalanine--D-glutamate ligase
VLFSPASSSFDEFSGFEERGRVFKSLVAGMIASRGGSK